MKREADGGKEWKREEERIREIELEEVKKREDD
jgi:hypothetical protein